MAWGIGSTWHRWGPRIRAPGTLKANLVVNADADQVIVASSERSEASELPSFHYEAGGLEEPHIRTLVCQYLEGGEEAFRRRAERYGDLVKRTWAKARSAS